MSTELRPLNEQTTLTRFWGGKERGVCVQVTQTEQEPRDTFNPLGVGYVQVNREEARRLAELLMSFAEGNEEEME